MPISLRFEWKWKPALIEHGILFLPHFVYFTNQNTGHDYSLTIENEYQVQILNIVTYMRMSTPLYEIYPYIEQTNDSRYDSSRCNEFNNLGYGNDHVLSFTPVLISNSH